MLPSGVVLFVNDDIFVRDGPNQHRPGRPFEKTVDGEPKYEEFLWIIMITAVDKLQHTSPT